MIINRKEKYIKLTIIFKEPEYGILITDNNENELLIFKHREYREIIKKLKEVNYEFDYIIADTQVLFLVNYLKIWEHGYIKEIFKYEDELPKGKGNQKGEGILNIIRRVSYWFGPYYKWEYYIGIENTKNYIKVKS